MIGIIGTIRWALDCFWRKIRKGEPTVLGYCSAVNQSREAPHTEGGCERKIRRYRPFLAAGENIFLQNKPIDSSSPRS